MTTATARRVIRATVGIADRGKLIEPNELRYYPAGNRLDYRPDAKTPVIVMLWVKQLLSEDIRSGFCRWDGVRYSFEVN